MRYSKILWFHGLYAGEIRRGYGGGERSFNMAEIISRIAESPVIHIALRNPLKRNQCFESNSVTVSMGRLSLVARIMLKPITVMLGPRSFGRVLGLDFLDLGKKDKVKLLDLIDSDTLIVLDSIKGYSMIKGIIEEVDRKAGLILYLSHNFEADYYASLKHLVMRLEKEAAEHSDIVVAASLRDRFRYIYNFKIPPEKIVVFPNVFPPQKEYIQVKNNVKTLAVIASSEACGTIARIVDLLDKALNIKIRVFGGSCPMKNSKHVEVVGFIKSRSAFLSELSKAHIGLNYGLWLGGSNLKKYDYAIAGLAIASNSIGGRCYPLPGEICFADMYDLASKLELIPVEEAMLLGRRNREKALEIYNASITNLKKSIERQ